jgi:2-keto-4-pentenoate hydratase
MTDVEPRLVAALAVQSEQRRRAIEAGAVPIGWKLGVGDAERIGNEIALGYLTSATLLAPGDVFRAPGDAKLHADAEVALVLGRDVAAQADTAQARAAIGAYAPALEVVDLREPIGTAEAVIADNIFHRAVAFGAARPELPPGVDACVLIDGRKRAEAPAPQDFGEHVRAAARLLGAMGERLRAGDRLITGSVVQVPVTPGDQVFADFGPLGCVALTIAP